MTPRPIKHTWGGKRIGAGRPAKETDTRRALFHIDELTDARLDERAAAEGITRSEALARCVAEWAERREGQA